MQKNKKNEDRQWLCTFHKNSEDHKHESITKLKLLDDNIRENLSDVMFGNNFLDTMPKTIHERKSWQVGLHQNGKLLHEKHC